MKDGESLDFDIVANHAGRVEGYLIGMQAPGEILKSFRVLTCQYVAVEIESDFNGRMDKLIDGAPIEQEFRRKWSDADKAAIWSARHTEGMRPAEIAKSYPGCKGINISNLLTQMKAAKYKPA